MARESIAMTPGELRAFLGAERRAVLGTLAQDGGPWADAVPCALRGDTLYLRIARGSRSHANIQRDPRVCCSFDRFPSYYEIKGATVHGRARQITDPALLRELDAAPGATGDGIVYALALDDVASFDFAKIKRKVT